MLNQLLAIKAYILKGSLRSTNEGKYRAPFFIILTIVFWAMVYWGSAWVVDKSLEVELVGELLVQKILSVLILIFLGLLTFSNIVTSFSTFFLADELQFLISKPIPSHTFFSSRFLEALAMSSWVVVLFGLPPFIAAGVGIGTGWTYYAALPFVLIPFVAIPTAVASVIALFLTNSLAASRTRDIGIFIGGFAFIVLFVVIRSMKPEQLLNPDKFNSLGQLLDLLSTPSSVWLPSDWVMNLLMPLLFQSSGVAYSHEQYLSIALLYSTPLALFFIAAFLYKKYYFRGYSRVQEGRHGASVAVHLRDWFHNRRRKGTIDQAQLLDLQLENLQTQPRNDTPLRQLVTKDLRIFTRDPSQWSQLLIVFAIMIIYLVNYKYIEVAADNRFFGEVGLYFFNLAACAFVVVSVTARFMFPAVSMEGRSFWMIMQAPISLESFLIGKWLGGILPVFVIGQFLIITSNLLVLESYSYLFIGSFLIAILTVGITALGTGLGAVYPQFYNPNAASVASSLGAVIYMILAMIMSLVVIALSYHVTRYFGAFLDGETYNYITTWRVLHFCFALSIPFAVAAISIKIGARSLRKRM